MNSMFIRIGNVIINKDHICASEYKHFDEGDAFVLKANSILYIFTTDGKERKFRDNQADMLWEVLCEMSLRVVQP